MDSQFPRELALLLSTSGTTGSPKLVRLSYENVNSNAAAVAQYLGLKQSDRAITSLPMNYSYGLSVINSHLIVGASLVLTEDSVIDNSFWKTFNDEKVTSFAGVPYSYELLSKIDFENFSLPSLKYMTQAGGRLSEGMIKYFGGIAKRQGFKFYVMYGQTEATARMSYLPPNKTLAYPSSIGIPIPGGKFELIDESNNIISEAGRTGELVYSGLNVMLGYAEKINDLFKNREIEFLKTGDLAKYDENGLYYIVGRKSRFLKIFGNRIGLDDVENVINASGYSVICGGTDKLMIVMTRQKGCKDAIETLIKEMFGLTREYLELLRLMISQFSRRVK